MKVGTAMKITNSWVMKQVKKYEGTNKSDAWKNAIIEIQEMEMVKKSHPSYYRMQRLAVIAVAEAMETIKEEIDHEKLFNQAQTDLLNNMADKVNYELEFRYDIAICYLLNIGYCVETSRGIQVASEVEAEAEVEEVSFNRVVNEQQEAYNEIELDQAGEVFASLTNSSNEQEEVMSMSNVEFEFNGNCWMLGHSMFSIPFGTGSVGYSATFEPMNSFFVNDNQDTITEYNFYLNQQDQFGSFHTVLYIESVIGEWELQALMNYAFNAASELTSK